MWHNFSLSFFKPLPPPTIFCTPHPVHCVTFFVLKFTNQQQQQFCLFILFLIEWVLYRVCAMVIKIKECRVCINIVFYFHCDYCTNGNIFASFFARAPTKKGIRLKGRNLINILLRIKVKFSIMTVITTLNSPPTLSFSLESFNAI